VKEFLVAGCSGSEWLQEALCCRGIAAKFTGSTAEGKAGGGNEVRGEGQAKERQPENPKMAQVNGCSG
jgi:hypothetical protein